MAHYEKSKSKQYKKQAKWKYESFNVYGHGTCCPCPCADEDCLAERMNVTVFDEVKS